MEVTLFIFAVVYLLIILGGVTFALVWSARRKLGALKTTGVVLATLFVLYAIPFGDHTLGEIKKHQLCREQGGTKIYQVVENADGFLWDTGRQMEPYETFGYSFFEAKTASGQIFRYSRNASGSIDEQRVESAAAKYSVYRAEDEAIGKNHSITRQVIMDTQNKKTLASRNTVAYHGGWLGFGTVSCVGEPPRVDIVEFVHMVLKPKKIQEK